MKYGELVQKHLRMCNFYCTFYNRKNQMYNFFKPNVQNFVIF